MSLGLIVILVSPLFSGLGEGGGHDVAFSGVPQAVTCPVGSLRFPTLLLFGLGLGVVAFPLLSGPPSWFVAQLGP